MYIDRRYHDRRRRRSRWPFLLILALFAAGAYLLLTRTTLVNSPLAPPTITPTATRTAASFASEAAEHYAFGRLAAAGSSYLRVTELDPLNDEAYSWLARIWVYRGIPSAPSRWRRRPWKSTAAR